MNPLEKRVQTSFKKKRTLWRKETKHLLRKKEPFGEKRPNVFWLKKDPLKKRKQASFNDRETL